MFSKSNKVKPKRSICKRTRKALRADKWWCSVYLKQMLQKNRGETDGNKTKDNRK
jgi:hypothetical protein